MIDGPLVSIRGPGYTVLTVPGLDALRKVYEAPITGRLTCPKCLYSGTVIVDIGKESKGLTVFQVKALCFACRSLIVEDVRLGEGDWKRLSRQQLDQILRRAKTLTAVAP